MFHPVPFPVDLRRCIEAGIDPPAHRMITPRVIASMARKCDQLEIAWKTKVKDRFAGADLVWTKICALAGGLSGDWPAFRPQPIIEKSFSEPCRY